MAKEKTLDEYNPYKNLDDAKLKQRGEVHRLKKDTVLQYMINEYLGGKKSTPNEYSAVVRRMVNFKDGHTANTDPFHSTEDDRERMHEGGVIKDAKDTIIAYVEVPSFFVPIRNLKNCYPPDYYHPLLRVDISKTGKKGERAAKLNEIIIIGFKDNNNFTEPFFKKFPKEKPVMFEADVRTKKKRAGGLLAFAAKKVLPGGEKCQAE
jgi:hypothetical protein